MQTVKLMKQRLVLVPVVIGILGLAAACSGQSAAPAATQAPAASRVAAATQASAPAAASASSSAGAQAPVRVASAIAVAATRAAQGQAPSAAKKIDACSLVTQPEAQAAATLPLPKQNPNKDGSSCEYSEADANGVTVTIDVDQIGTKGSFDRTKQTVADNRVDVPGVGDGAFIIKGLRVMYVLKGDTLLRIQLANPFLAEAVYVPNLTTLGKLAVSRL